MDVSILSNFVFRLLSTIIAHIKKKHASCIKKKQYDGYRNLFYFSL